MRHVLIVDDHEVVRRGCCDILREGFPEMTTREVGNTREAHAQLATSSWDLVLLDLMLPGRSGLDLLADIKRAWLRIPTAFGHDSDSKRTEFRSKPDTVPIEFGQCSD
jgi:DNA-binding NarL/FixJ family response regulator